MTAVQCNAVLLVISKWSQVEYMQTILQKRKIEAYSRIDEILEILADQYCRDIIEITMKEPKSAIEIAEYSEIPLSTVYRRLQTLHDRKLLAISGMISEEGKKLFLYKSKIKSICVNYDESQVQIEMVPNIPSVAKEGFSIR